MFYRTNFLFIYIVNSNFAKQLDNITIDIPYTTSKGQCTPMYILENAIVNASAQAPALNFGKKKDIIIAIAKLLAA